MRFSSQFIGFGRHLQCLVRLLSLSIIVSGCTGLHESPEARICRGLIPAINAVDTQITIRRTEAVNPTGLIGRGMTIIYRAERDTGAPQRTGEKARLEIPKDQRTRLISCIFAREPLNGAPDLLALATEQGLVGDVRLYLLKKHWIKPGHAATHDPDPVTMISSAPELPRILGEPLQQLLAALPSIGISALLATAFALVYGLIGRITLVFGEITILTAAAGYLGFHLGGGFDQLTLAPVLFVVLGGLSAASMGWALSSSVIGRLATRPGQHLLIASVGLSTAAMEALRLFQGTGTKWLSPLLARPIGIARMDGLVITLTPMAPIVFTIALSATGLLLLLLKTTGFGRAWRATADDPLAAAMFGIDPMRTILVTTILATLLAGAAGLLTMLYFGTAGQGSVISIGLKALIAAIIGGIGSVPGALAGGLVIGVAEALWATYFPIEYRDIALYVGLVLILTWKPEGLFSRPMTTSRQIP